MDRIFLNQLMSKIILSPTGQQAKLIEKIAQLRISCPVILGCGKFTIKDIIIAQMLQVPCCYVQGPRF